MKSRFLKRLFLIAIACGALAPAARAATLFWNSPNVGAWGDPLNWTASVAPGSADVVFIGPMAGVDVGLPPAPVTPFTVDTINFIAGASDIIPFYDTSNSGPPGSWKQITVTTAITNLGLGQVVFRSTKVSTPKLDVYSGNLEIADNNIFQAGVVNIYGGTVCAGTSFPGAIISAGAGNWNVYSGGTLNSRSPGSTITGSVFLFGGSYFNPGCSVGTATIAGNLTYSPGARSRFELGVSGTAGSGVNDLIIVNGNLSFNGALLEIVPLTGFGPGFYRLIECTGTITGTPTIESGPAGYVFQISTATPGQINLFVSSVISYTGGTLTENFDSMGTNGTNTPPGWFVGYAGPTNLTTVGVSDGSIAPNGNAGWNFGTQEGTPNSAERALGTMATSVGSPAPNDSRFVCARIRNRTGQSLSSITVSYSGEQWRTGDNTTNLNALVLQYSADGRNFVNMGSAFNFTQRTFTPLSSALNGNDPTNGVAVIPPDGTIFVLSPVIPPDGTIFLRWFDANDAGTDPALAIDNFSFSATPDASPPVITSQPQSLTVEEGRRATFSVAATGSPPRDPLHYQWGRNGSPMLGATNATFTLPNVRLADGGSVFHVLITNASGSVTSAPAVLTVFEDIVRPSLASATPSCVSNTVRVVYSEPMNPFIVQDPFIYVISGGIDVLDVSVAGDGKTVTLSTGPLDPNTVYTLRACPKSRISLGIMPVCGVGCVSWRCKSTPRRWFRSARNHAPGAGGASTSRRCARPPSAGATL